MLGPSQPGWQPPRATPTSLRQDSSLTDTTVPDLEIYMLIGAFLADAAPQAFATLQRERPDLALSGTLPNGHPASYIRRLLQRLVDLYGRMPHAIPGLSSLLGVGNASVLLDKIIPPRIPTFFDNLSSRSLGLLHKRVPIQAALARSCVPVRIPLCKVLIWVLTSCAQLATLVGHIEIAYVSVFDCLSRRLLTGSDDYLVKMWSVATGDLLYTLRGHEKEICAVTVSKDNTLIATASLDHSARVWRMSDGKPLALLRAHSNGLSDISFFPSISDDSGMLLTAGLDGTCRIWTYSGADFTLHPSIYRSTEGSKKARIRCVNISPGGARFAVGYEDGNVRLFLAPRRPGTDDALPDVELMYPTTGLVLSGHRGYVTTVLWSEQGDRILSGSYDGTLRVWYFDMQMRAWNAVVLRPGAETSTAATATTTAASTATTATAAAAAAAAPPSKVTTAQWASSDRLVIAALSDFSVRVWDPTTGAVLSTWRAHTQEVYALLVHPTVPDLVVSGGHDGQVCFWDLRKRVQLHRTQPFQLAFF